MMSRPLTALCLGAYIVDLTLVLHKLFTDTLNMEPLRTFSEELVFDTLEHYSKFDAPKVHCLVREIALEKLHLHPEEKIVDLIKKQLNMEREL
jgi:hypothetical protein